MTEPHENHAPIAPVYSTPVKKGCCLPFRIWSVSRKRVSQAESPTSQPKPLAHSLRRGFGADSFRVIVVPILSINGVANITPTIVILGLESWDLMQQHYQPYQVALVVGIMGIRTVQQVDEFDSRSTDDDAICACLVNPDLLRHGYANAPALATSQVRKRLSKEIFFRGALAFPISEHERRAATIQPAAAKIGFSRSLSTVVDTSGTGCPNNPGYDPTITRVFSGVHKSPDKSSSRIVEYHYPSLRSLNLSSIYFFLPNSSSLQCISSSVFNKTLIAPKTAWTGVID